MSARCEHFAKTKIPPPPGGIEKQCFVCPLRNERGECIKDIMDNKGLEIELEISEIWRKFYDTQKNSSRPLA